MRSKAGLSPRLKSDLTLLLVAVVWGSGFVAQRLGGDRMSALYFNGGRFLLGALLLLVLNRLRWPLPRQHLAPAALTGAILFVAASLQQFAIPLTTVGNVAFFTGLYVVLIPLLLWAFARQRTPPLVWLAAGLAALGVGLLGLQDTLALRPGDLLALAGAFGWAVHVIFIGRFAKQIDGLGLAVGQFLTCAALNLLAGLIFDPGGAGNILLAWQAVVYSAVIPIGVGYTLQIFGQQSAPPVDAAIILSLEAVFGGLFGWLMLGEGFSLQQLLGAALILAAIVLSQVAGMKVEGKKAPNQTEAYRQ